MWKSWSMEYYTIITVNNTTMLQYWIYWINFILINSRHIYVRYIYLHIYIYKVSCIHSFFVIFICSFFLHYMLNTFRYEKHFVKLMSRLLHSTTHQVMWCFLVFIVNPFSHLWSFFSQENCVSFDLLVSCLSLGQSA